MAIFKCKMCGGTLEIHNETVAVCEYCGTKQTLPKLDDEKRANLYDRANHFRRNNEFDKAIGIYEQILNEDGTDAEAYWSLVLCRYGIEYVEDPATKRRVPTVNRAQFTSIFDDDNYTSAIRYADGYQKELYEQEAKAINEIQRGILAVSQREEPFDVFICYKETDHNGRRTPDSVLAQELYYELKEVGFKVFFSRITLEDKLGSAYEPYIFAALNSAKVMVVLGTKPEYFQAVWVKNEWSRYLALIKNGADKVLIPAYRDMDPYDLPEEFSHLQAQDMSKLGFMQDLIHGIRKLVGMTASNPAPAPVSVEHTVVSGNVDALLKRGYMALEDGEWAKADEFFEQTLNFNAELAEAYLGKLLAELQVCKPSDLINCAAPFDDYGNYQKTIRFADAASADRLKACNAAIRDRNEQARLDSIYDAAQSRRRDAEACVQSGRKVVAADAYFQAKTLFDKISGWKDAAEQSAYCAQQRTAMALAIAADEREAELAWKEKELRDKRTTRIAMCFVFATIALVLIVILINTVIIPNNKYNNALELYENGEYRAAVTVLMELHHKERDELLQQADDADDTFTVLGDKIFDTIVLGAYEQDGDEENGKEPIEWVVLQENGDQKLVVSRYVLLAQTFEEIEHLDTAFFKKAFSTTEQKAIRATGDGGHMRLLSSSEIDRYFESEEQYLAEPTSMVKADLWTSSDGYCDWWLSDDGQWSGYKKVVSPYGGIDESGEEIYMRNGVRPAMWVDMSAIETEE